MNNRQKVVSFRIKIKFSRTWHKRSKQNLPHLLYIEMGSPQRGETPSREGDIDRGVLELQAFGWS
jgi:hypothetical protein